MIVRDILEINGGGVKTTLPDTSIRAAARKMVAENVGALVVSDDNGVLIGIITERDITCGLAAHGLGLNDLTVSALMKRSIVTCAETDSLLEISRVMTEQRLRQLPVNDSGQLVGLVSIGDVLKYWLDEMRIENYVLRDLSLAAR